MKAIRTLLLAFALPLLLQSCAVLPHRDSCSRSGDFSRYNFSPMHDSKMVSPQTLPSRVQRGVNLWVIATRGYPSSSSPEQILQTWPDPADRSYFPILLARDEGRYFLLEVRGASFDGNWFVVYSKELDCIAGRFAWRTQG